MSINKVYRKVVTKQFFLSVLSSHIPKCDFYNQLDVNIVTYWRVLSANYWYCNAAAAVCIITTLIPHYVREIANNDYWKNTGIQGSLYLFTTEARFETSSSSHLQSRLTILKTTSNVPIRWSENYTYSDVQHMEILF